MLMRLIAERNVRHICEIGGGANPALPLDYLTERGIEYTVLDISKEELAKAPAGYRTLHQDILSPALAVHDRFDLVFSRMVAEHVNDARRFHGNVHRLLRAGGTAFHYFPTLMAVPFMANKVLAGPVSRWLLTMVQGEREQMGRHAKFPAYYKWCRGPIPRQMRRLQRLGYLIDAYHGFFGHTYYARVKPLYEIHRALTRMLIRHPVPAVTAYAYLVMRKVTAPYAETTRATGSPP
ncbi:MAG: class I SAM-dependent methyltransferase [Bacteroidetes bacterium]|nr:class I SAM-dependent methyltransferase [Bacteroidota bacterium]